MKSEDNVAINSGGAHKDFGLVSVVCVCLGRGGGVTHEVRGSSNKKIK